MNTVENLYKDQLKQTRDGVPVSNKPKLHLASDSGKEKDGEVENQEDRHAENLKRARNAAGLMAGSNPASNITQALNPVGLMRQIHFLGDMPYVAALGAAILKDVLDVAFIGSLPGIGTVITLCCSIFIFMMMVLVGGSKKRKYFLSLTKKAGILFGATLVEFVPGLDFVPTESLSVAAAYYLELKERLEDSNSNEE